MKRSQLTTLVLALVIAALSYFGFEMPGTQAPSGVNGKPALTASGGRSIGEADLPAQARQTMALIRKGGPFPYDKDGTTFGNREKRLPEQSRGYYREYTVDTPGVSHRGARRIVTGGRGTPPKEYYYTQDHYESFRTIVEDAR